jgi:hypothetical protein
MMKLVRDTVSPNIALLLSWNEIASILEKRKY